MTTADDVGMQQTKVSPGEIVELDFRNGRQIRVTDNMYNALLLLRPALIQTARASATMTYGQASEVCERAYIPQGMGKLLDVLSVDCERRGEPSLAALVVRQDAGEVGDSFIGDAKAARLDCYAHWSA